MTETLSERVKTIYEFYKVVCADDITDIFVTDYIADDGSRVYENLWFFTPKYVMEAKRFIQKDDFDMDSIQNRIVYWNIIKHDYDFEGATETSRFHLVCRLDTNGVCDLKASRENCDYLKKIFLKYFLPNLKA